jgi:hypothetical protein
MQLDLQPVQLAEHEAGGCMASSRASLIVDVHIISPCRSMAIMLDTEGVRERDAQENILT